MLVHNPGAVNPLRCLLPLLACAALSGGCGEPTPEPASAPAAPAPGREAPAPQPAAGGPLVVFLGDSLTAGLGVTEQEAFPEQVRRLLAERGIEVRITNAGVSGDSTAGGLTRLDWVLGQRPDLVVVALGGNDGLRGLSVEQTEANLRAIVETARRAGARVLLLGMLLPPNYGSRYTDGFREIYPRLARELDVALVPFLLDGVAGVAGLNQADGIHPTAAGHQRMAATVAPALAELVEGGG